MRIYPPLLLPDHSLITATSASHQERIVLCRSRVKRRCWKKFDVDAFTTDLLEFDLVVNPLINVTELFDSYNITLSQLVDWPGPGRYSFVLFSTHCAVV